MKIILAAACMAFVGAQAASIDVQNHSFETPVIPPDSFSTTSAPPGWIAIGNINFGWRAVGVVNPNTTLLYLDPVPLGSNIGVTFLGPTFSNLPSGMHQTLATSLQARTTYTLSVAVGNMAYVATPPHNQFNFNGFPGYRVELLAGGTVIASDNNSLLPSEGRFLTSTVSYVASSTETNIGQALGIRLINLDQAAGIEVNFDDVRLDATALPDPEISISNQPNGIVRVDFTDVLQESADLAAWTNVTPQPLSPLLLAPTGSVQFFRASE